MPANGEKPVPTPSLRQSHEPEPAAAFAADSSPVSPDSDWKTSLARAIRDPRELLRRLSLNEAEFPDLPRVDFGFPLLVPVSYVDRMVPGDPHDPLLRQVLPIAAEGDQVPGYTSDPVSDAEFRVAGGLLQKYAGRALLIATGSCAIHCRYCFRRHYPYGAEPRTWEAWQPALDAIREDRSLREVILSGGDPLILSDRRLGELLDTLDAIPHLTRLRIHSRLPVVLPNRVTPQLLNKLQQLRLRSIMVIHANHARELVADAAAAVRALVVAGIPVLNQAVLLRGVNDSVEALVDLCERCIDLGAIPYYLHQLDRVQGAAHFEVPEPRGREIVDQLRSLLPGYAVPRYVREIPGKSSKWPL